MGFHCKLFFAHSRLAEVFSALGEPDAAERHKQLADTTWSKYFEFQSRLVVLMNELTINIKSKT